MTQTVDSPSTLSTADPQQLGRPWNPAMCPTDGRAVRVTPMQGCVLESLCEGKSNRLIARDWGISEDTAKSHLRALIKITGARDRTHLVAQIYSGELQIRVGSLRRSRDY